eukprot:2240205-Alexandrium_andersonii.AAC.1
MALQRQNSFCTQTLPDDGVGPMPVRSLMEELDLVAAAEAGTVQEPIPIASSAEDEPHGEAPAEAKGPAE